MMVYLSVTVYGQPMHNYNFYNITEKEGLVDNSIKCVAVDNRGWLWVGTINGISCINGSNATSWNRLNENDDECLVNDIIISNRTTVFAATTRGVYRLLANDTKWQKILWDAELICNAMFIDNDFVWIASNKGLYSINMGTLQTKKYNSYIFKDSLENSYNNDVHTISKGHENTLILGTTKQLIEFNRQTHQFTLITKDAPLESLPLSITQLTQDYWIISMYDRPLKLVSWQNGRYAMSRFSLFNNGTNEKIYSYSLGNGMLNLQSNNRHFIFNPITNTFAFSSLQQFSNSLISNASVYMPQQKKLVLATKKGLTVVDVMPHQFHHVRYATKADLPTQGIHIKEWNNQLVIGAGRKNFLQSFNLKQLVTDTVAKPILHIQKPYSCLAIEPTGNRLLIGSENGLLQLDNRFIITKKIVANNANTCTLPTNFIEHIFIDSKKRYWIFPWRKGIWQTDSSLNCFTLQKEGFEKLGRKKKLVIANAKEDIYGNIWFADLDEGLIKWEAKTNTFLKPLKKEMGELWQLESILYKHPYIWLCSKRTEMVSYNIDTKQTAHYAIPTLYQKEFFYATLNGRHVWMTTALGLLSFDITTHQWQKFTQQDGLLFDRLDASLASLSNGQMLLAQENYLTLFNPDSLLVNLKTPNVQLALLQANDSLYTNSIINNKYNLSLPYNQNNISLEWSIADFGLPFNNIYYYRIKSKDTAWQYAGNKGLLNLISLSPGHYTIELWAANARGIYANKPLSIHLTIKYPFWFTWWFIGLAAMFISCVVVYAVRKRINTIKQQALVKQQLAELEMKALKAQMNPHFIFNSLTSIQESIVNGNTEAATNYLGKFSKLIRLALEQSDERLITIQQEIDYITLYLELESFRFDDFTFSINHLQVNDTEFYKIPSMVVQPFVENAIKHGLAHKQGNKFLKLHYEKQQDVFLISVTDNGVGRQAAAKINKTRIASHKSMGIKITEQRLFLIDEKIANIVIQDLKDDNGNANGTMVLITIPIENN